MSPLPITNIVNLFNSQMTIFEFSILFAIVTTLIYRIIKRNNEWKGLDLILQRIAEFLIFITIDILILAYYTAMLAVKLLSIVNIDNSLVLYTAIISFNAAFILTLITLIIETKNDKSPLLKEIQNIDISKLKKFLIGIFVDVIPFILTSIMVISFIYLEMFPRNIGLINIILEAIKANTLIISLDVTGSFIAAAVNGKINRKANIRLNEII